jgi:hypothetical protein
MRDEKVLSQLRGGKILQLLLRWTQRTAMRGLQVVQRRDLAGAVASIPAVRANFSSGGMRLGSSKTAASALRRPAQDTAHF